MNKKEQHKKEEIINKTALNNIGVISNRKVYKTVFQYTILDNKEKHLFSIMQLENLNNIYF